MNGKLIAGGAAALAALAAVVAAQFDWPTAEEVRKQEEAKVLAEKARNDAIVERQREAEAKQREAEAAEKARQEAAQAADRSKDKDEGSDLKVERTEPRDPPGIEKHGLDRPDP